MDRGNREDGRERFSPGERIDPPDPLENRFSLRRQSAVRGRATPYMYELAPLLLTERESLYRVMYVKILAVCYRLRAKECERERERER